MSKVGRVCFGMARFIAIVAVLLFAPLTASATGSDTHAPIYSEHGVVGDRTDNSLDTMERHGSPVETPLHCHLKPPHSQASGLTQTSVEGDLPLLALAVISAPARETATRLPAISVHVPIAGPPRFILFGSFRS